jgi:hypothetical protein
MRSPDEYRKYAKECERIAREGPEENRRVLLEIAAAWRQCAEEAERQGTKPFDRAADTKDA